MMSNSNIYNLNEDAKDVKMSSEDSHLTPNSTSNEYVLNVAFLSFFFFMIFEGIFAIIANSQSMLADALAMSVDAFTYLFNLVAERLKHKTKWFGPTSISSEQRKRHRKLVRLYLEFIPPMISVTALICVSAQAFVEAVSTIMGYSNHSDEDDTKDSPDVVLMLFFSALNLLLDVLNVFFFSKVQHFSISSIRLITGGGKITIRVGKDSSVQKDEIVVVDEDNRSKTPSILIEGDLIQIDDLVFDKNIIQFDDDENLELLSTSTTLSYGSYNISSLVEDKNGKSLNGKDRFDKLLDSISEDEESENGRTMESESDDDQGNGLNLNMCSAYTHVMADTLRSIAVLVAAAIAYFDHRISPTVADATAAIVVSVIIAVSLGPLIIGLLETWSEIQELKRESLESDISIRSAAYLEQFQNLPSLHYHD